MAIATPDNVRKASAKSRSHPIGPDTTTEDAAWKGLFKVGSVAALIAGLVFRRNLGAEFMLLRSVGIINVGPTTSHYSVLDWFGLLQNNRLLGLTLLNFFDMVNYALVGLMFLALFAALWRASRSLIAIAASLSFVGITVYFASNQALTMLSLSDQYAAATTEAQRAVLLAAGQATLASHQNAGYEGTGLYLSFFLVTVAGLLISAVMLRSRIRAFSKVTAYMGILANGFGLGYYLALAFAPVMVALPLSISALFLLAWYVLIGRQLWTNHRIHLGS